MKRETIIMDEYGKVTVPSDTANLPCREPELQTRVLRNGN